MGLADLGALQETASDVLTLLPVCSQAGAVQAMSIFDDTLFLGSAGRVRAMDVSSGGHAGEQHGRRFASAI